MNDAPCRVKAKQKPEPGVSKRDAGLSVVILSEGEGPDGAGRALEAEGDGAGLGVIAGGKDRRALIEENFQAGSVGQHLHRAAGRVQGQGALVPSCAGGGVREAEKGRSG